MVMTIYLTYSTTVDPTRSTINKSHDLSTHEAVVAVRRVRELIHPKMLSCKSKLGITVKAARMFVNNSILSRNDQDQNSLGTFRLTLKLGKTVFEPLNLSTLATSDLCCSKKQNRGIDIVLTVRVKSCKRSASISESLSTTLSRLLCSPSDTADAMEAITDAFDCEPDPRCGVPKKMTPATDLMMDG